MTFSIGQTVEVSDPNGLDGFEYGGYMYLDRGTVIHTIGKSLVKLNMHKTRLHYSNTLYAWADCLRLYVPLDAPGRNKRSYETMQALNIVLLEETPPAMKEVIRELEHTRRDVERARMTAEDYSEGNSRMYSDGMTWRMRKQIYGRIIINQSTTLVQIKDTMMLRNCGSISDHNCIAQIRESLDELDV